MWTPPVRFAVQSVLPQTQMSVKLHGVKQPKQYLAIVDTFDIEIFSSKDIPKPKTPTPPPSGPIFITKITIQKAPTVQVSVEVTATIVSNRLKCDTFFRMSHSTGADTYPVYSDGW